MRIRFKSGQQPQSQTHIRKPEKTAAQAMFHLPLGSVGDFHVIAGWINAKQKSSCIHVYICLHG